MYVTDGKKKCIMFIRTSGVRDDVISTVTDAAGVEERVWRWCSVLAVRFGPPHKPCFSYFLIYCADYTLSCLFNAFAHCTTVMAVLSYCLYTKREDGAIFIFIKWKETIKKSGLVCCSLSPKCTVVHVIVRTCMNNARAHVCVRML